MSIINRLCAARAMKSRIAERRCRLYKVAFAWCGERHVADDLVQETMIKAMEKSHQLKDPSCLDSWLYSILNNCWRQHLRGRRTGVELDEQALKCTCCPEQVNLYSELTRRVLEFMAALPEGQRQVISLVAFEELSYRQVADALDIPIGTVMSRLARARSYLNERLKAAARPVDTPRAYIKRVK